MALSQRYRFSTKSTLTLVQKLPSLEVDRTFEVLSDQSTSAPSRPVPISSHPLDSPYLPAQPKKKSKNHRVYHNHHKSKHTKSKSSNKLIPTLKTLPTTVYCAGFAKVLTADQLKHILSDHFGAVDDVLLNLDHAGRSKGSGFAVFASEESANLALGCTQEYLDGCRIIILPFKGRTKQSASFALASRDPQSPQVSKRSSRMWGCERTREQNLSDRNIRFNIGSNPNAARVPTIAMGQTVCRVN